MRAGHKKRKLFRIIREGNYTSFPGFYGYLMRNFYTLPLSKNRKVMHELLTSVDTLLSRGNFVLVYPEQSMWWNYRKPKPLKEGAFTMAMRSRVPVLPCFITMRDTDRLGADGYPIQEHTVHISKPIYPHPDLSPRENVKYMQEENERIWREIYEREYGMPLVYKTK
jgi:1-acyl-sn-glycerol-3-phosphate acyltransferase